MDYRSFRTPDYPLIIPGKTFVIPKRAAQRSDVRENEKKPLSRADRTAALSRSALPFALHPPERTDAKPDKHQRETKRDYDPFETGLSSMILGVLVGQRRAPAESHQQEDQPSYFEPQLMQNFAKSPASGSQCTAGCPQHAVAPGLLRRNPRHHP